MPEAVSLHHHTTYSFLDGYGTPEEHLQRAAELGYTSLAFTEHGNTSSHFRAEKAANKIGTVKPIFGIEAYTSTTEGISKQTKFHLTVLAADQEGYRNLNLAVTRSWKQHHWHPTMTGSDVSEFGKGLIILSGCSGSYMACTMIGGKGLPKPENKTEQRLAFEKCEGIAERFDRLHPGRFYLEVQAFPELESCRKINKAYGELSKLTGIPLVATLDCHYPTPEDSDMQVILHACGPQGRGMASADEMLRRWNYDVKLTLPATDHEFEQKLVKTGLSRLQARAAVENTTLIASQCNVTLPKAERLQFPCPEGWTADELIWEWLREGWRYRRISNRTRKEQDWYLDRLKYEMNMVFDKDFVDFFLATSDVVRWCKDDGNSTPIPVGPGRGSAAASVVCWLLRITEIDPGRYRDMLFERFIDVTRTDPPDIDLDFSDDRRHEVREYLERKYGKDCVGTIANFVRYRGKNALVDVARVHRVPHAAKKIVSDLIIERSGGDSRFDASLEDTVDMFPNAKAIFDAFPSLWLATRLEGNVRGMSVHAAGLVVANSPLTDVCATYARDDRQVLSIDKYDAEYAGMLKMDFLGLTTMGMIDRCLRMTGLTLEDLYAVPDDDPDTLDIFQRNDVTGIFQFTGRATRIVCRDVHPKNFSEVADINALSRPGPLFSGTTADYCDVKHGRKKAERYHAIVDEITSHTYGQIIYQEQILKILQVIGGFDWTDLNEIRRIIAKKVGQAAFQVSMDNFQKGALELHGIKPETSDKIWKHIVTSGTYAFNIAHAVSYSMLAWWCAYLKAHHPAEFYASSLGKAEGGKETSFKLMRDAQKHNILVLPPDVSLSGKTWDVLPDAGPDGESGVIAGFESIPGIGDTKADKIANHKTPFGDWRDLIAVSGIGKKTIDNMREFCESDDPFELEKTGKIIRKVTDAIKTGEIKCPMPIHDGDAVAAERAHSKRRDLGVWGSFRHGKQLIYAGIVKNRIYQDIVENIRSRTGEETEDIEANLSQPELRKYCVLQCFDASQEEVYIRINRFNFPRFRGRLESIAVGNDVVIVAGRKTPGFGVSIAINDLWVVDPE